MVFRKVALRANDFATTTATFEGPETTKNFIERTAGEREEFTDRPRESTCATSCAVKRFLFGSMERI